MIHTLINPWLVISAASAAGVFATIVLYFVMKNAPMPDEGGNDYAEDMAQNKKLNDWEKDMRKWRK